MLNIINKFLRPPTKTYTYALTKAEVTATIRKQLPDEVRFWGTSDFVGKFTETDHFNIQLMLPVAGFWNYGSKLSGRIVALPNSTTQVQTRVHPSLFMYVSCCCSCIAGIINLAAWSTPESATKSWVISITLTLALPLGIMAFHNIIDAVLQKRYLMYIDKAVNLNRTM